MSIGARAAAVVGGAPADDAPAVGRFNVANASLCSGSLIAPNVVLTAGHCFSSFYPSELAQSPPVWFFVGERPPVRAARVVVPPGDCRWTKSGRDLAYVVLSEPISGVKPLAVERAPVVGAECTYRAIGYGRTQVVEQAPADGTPGSAAPLCSGLTARPSDASPLDTSSEVITPDGEPNAISLCLDEERGEGNDLVARSPDGATCKGDSGGPLIDTTTGKIVAVTSGGAIVDGVQCQPNSSVILNPVAPLSDFIDEALAAGAAAGTSAPAVAPSTQAATPPTNAAAPAARSAGEAENTADDLSASGCTLSHSRGPNAARSLLGVGALGALVARRRRNVRR